MQAVKVTIKGIVQGVGFRPFIHRLVRRHHLSGTVRNTSSGVTLELEGEAGAIQMFLDEIPAEAPPLAVIEEIQSREIPEQGFRDFRIIGSERQTERKTLISPDIAICPDCLKELRDPDGIDSPSSTARTADRGLRSLRTCRMTGQRPQ